MTVAELIEKLEDFNPNLEVALDEDSDEDNTVKDVQLSQNEKTVFITNW